MITVISNHLFRFVPRSKSAGPEAHEDGANEFAEGGCVDWIQFLLLTVAQVMVVEGTAGQTHSLRCLVVVQEPLKLKIRGECLSISGVDGLGLYD